VSIATVLGKLIFLIRANQQTLVEITKGGANVIFHLLVPSAYSIAITQPFYFDSDLGPLFIKGYLNKGQSLA
jgi:hypothetical protein